MSLLIHPNDTSKMNWIEGTHDFGEVVSIDGITYSKERIETENGLFREKYTFTNTTEFDIITQTGDIGIYTPFNDNYESAEVCMTNRCHAHIWCGLNSSYIMALRMGGIAPHLGLILTNGSIETYSVERDIKNSSNDRGDFILHPAPVHLVPNESFTIEWDLFWHDGKDDFLDKIRKYKNYIDIRANRYTLYEGETLELILTAHTMSNINIKCNGISVDYRIKDEHVITINYIPELIGEHNFIIEIDGIKTKTSVIVLPNLNDFTKTRCHFIATKQQYHSPDSPLDGAYLIYDNEEHRMFYNHKNDYNGGRERIGMGILIAKYLQTNADKVLMESLEKYIVYITRELFDSTTGEVYNDIKRNNDWYRLYNHPWMSLFFLEVYKLTKKKDYLLNSTKALNAYYKNGGAHFYPIELPMYEIITSLKKAGEHGIVEQLMIHFKEHADFIIQTGTSYPASEVNYEQSIVAPATNCLLQMYQITGEAVYLSEAKKQLNILELFNGMAPDYHLYETAIRHWDGYWFGKYRLFGDTFPHYWSALTGNAFYDYYMITKDENYYNKAIHSIRGTLNLINPNGSASCARIYPHTVNGSRANTYDPWANDQDWGLYFAFRVSDKT